MSLDVYVSQAEPRHDRRHDPAQTVGPVMVPEEAYFFDWMAIPPHVPVPYAPILASMVEPIIPGSAAEETVTDTLLLPNNPSYEEPDSATTSTGIVSGRVRG